jgi:hypothetical protein
MGPDTVPASSFAAALRHDLARLPAELGLAQLRVTVVDLPMLAFQAGWSMGPGGEFTSVAPSDRKPDTVFPGAAEPIRDLVEAGIEHTLVRKLSPRRWVFAWRLDELHLALAEAQFTERHDDVSDGATNLLRALCTTLISTGGGTVAGPGGAAMLDAAQAWPHVDRRARVKPLVPVWLLPALLSASVLSAGWLTLAAAPEVSARSAAQQAELQRLRSTGEATVTHGLALALATGDYGEVQAALSLFETQGYFKNATVINARQRVVAVVGGGERQRIGDLVTPEYISQARTLDLKLGEDTVGRLLRADPAAPLPGSLSGGLGGAATVALLGALASLGVVAFNLVRRRRG